ncbi:hypothetical protein [Calycomorphotria hydatis]|uniref:Uncharacterized protein n=1 Tax=Calycomorphotria hydatis TaxID=2528027 RepID=A0A517TEU8_9PLAN|nr:hypothetical protein [Calycomorphotria hydatis]QDT66901.1 hypothetical protein V22_41730 [Calycomorphotria hydatis]
MKLLDHKDGLGYFLSTDNEYVPIDKITKDDLLNLVERALLSGSDVELSEYDEASIKNRAHQIIYKSLFDKLEDLIVRRDEFVDESERLYLEEYEKYTKELAENE